MNRALEYFNLLLVVVLFGLLVFRFETLDVQGKIGGVLMLMLAVVLYTFRRQRRIALEKAAAAEPKKAPEKPDTTPDD